MAGLLALLALAAAPASAHIVRGAGAAGKGAVLMQGMAAQDPFTEGQAVEEDARQEAIQTSGLCTEATANGMPEGGGHDHTKPEEHRALACRIEQVATLSLKKELADSGFEPDSILGEMDVRQDIAAVAVAFPEAGILFFDVSNPAGPRFLSAYKGRECDGQPIDIDCGAFVDLSQDGKVAFLAVQNLSGFPAGPGIPGTPGVEVVDLRNPRAPLLTQSYVAAAGLTGVHTSRSGVVPETGGAPRRPGEYVFATRNGFGVSVGEVIRPGGIPQIVPVSEIESEGIHDSFVQEDPLTNRTFLYIADGFDTGFKIFDVTDPANAELKGQWDLTPECGGDWYAHTIDVTTRSGRRYVTLPAELFDGGEASQADKDKGCNPVDGSSDRAGPMWIVDATDLASLAQSGDAPAVEKEKSENALVTTWRNPAGRAGGNITFSPHNQQIVGDKIYLSNYHGGVIGLDASKAFNGAAEPPAMERPVEVSFKVPDVLDQRPAFQNLTSPLIPFFTAFPLGRPQVWDLVVYKGCILSQDMSGGLYSLRESDSDCGAGSSGATATGQGGAVSGAGTYRLPARCSKPRGRLRPRNIGAARLGRTRAAQRRGFVRTTRRRKLVDRFCLTDGKYIRVGYASRAAARSGAKPRPRLRGKTIIALTASRRYAIRGVRAGNPASAMRRRIKGLSRPYRLGPNTWYLAKGSSSRLVFRVRGGRVREIGVADLGVTEERRRTRRLLRLFDTN